MLTETETYIEYSNRSITPPCFNPSKGEHRLIGCTATENLILPHNTKVLGGRYTNVFVGTLAQMPSDRRDVRATFDETHIDCLRVGPYGWALINGGMHSKSLIDRCVCNGIIDQCSDTAFHRLSVKEGGIVHLFDRVIVGDIIIDRATVVVHNDTVKFLKTIDLLPGGIIKFAELQETPHLDIVVSREKRTYREPANDGKEYTVIIG